MMTSLSKNIVHLKNKGPAILSSPLNQNKVYGARLSTLHVKLIAALLYALVFAAMYTRGPVAVWGLMAVSEIRWNSKFRSSTPFICQINKFEHNLKWYASLLVNRLLSQNSIHQEASVAPRCTDMGSVYLSLQGQWKVRVLVSRSVQFDWQLQEREGQ